MRRNRRLNRIINESVKRSIRRILREGATVQDGLIEPWDNAIRIMGEEDFLNELWNYLNSDQIRNYLEWIDRHYQLGLFNDEDDENEDEDDDFEDYEDEEEF